MRTIESAEGLVWESEESWSLRSRGDFDVGNLARSLGGGGHRAAAGFSRLRRGAGQTPEAAAQFQGSRDRVDQ